MTQKNHTIEDIEFTGNPQCGHLYFVADGDEVDIDGEFFMDKEGNIRHEHWFDEEGEDKVEVVINICTYDVVFNDSENSNSKGFEQSLEYCKGYIESFNGTNESYFEDYKGGTVSVVCNETGETIYEEEVR